MFKKLKRKILRNPLDQMLKKSAKKKAKNVLVAWNRGLGDIALGLYAIIIRIKKYLPDARITFLIREDLKDGFSMLKDIDVLVAKDWKRHKLYNVSKTLSKLNIEERQFDLIIEKPDPTYWVKWQIGKVVPKLVWDPSYEDKYKTFVPDDKKIYIGIQPAVETTYGLWRNWPIENYDKIFSFFKKNTHLRFLLLGQSQLHSFHHENVIDLRGKTTLFELLSIIKNRCHSVILPDSGILTLTYFLDKNYPLNVLSFWGDPNHGILKQAVSSPNKSLKHYPFVGKKKQLSSIHVETIINHIENLCTKEK